MPLHRPFLLVALFALCAPSPVAAGVIDLGKTVPVRAETGNRAIAGRLGLSHRTVEVHVATILRKLTVTSRTGAAARAPPGRPAGGVGGRAQGAAVRRRTRRGPDGCRQSGRAGSSGRDRPAPRAS